MKNSPLWEQRFEHYLDLVRVRYKSPRTVLLRARRFWNWFLDRELNWEELSYQVFEDYILYLHQREYPYTARTVYNLLRQAVAIAEHFSQAGYLLPSWDTRNLMKHPPKNRRPWVPEPEEVLGMLQCPDPSTPLGIRDRAILELFYGSALRLQEMTRLQLEDVDLSCQTVRLNDTKNHCDRLLPLTQGSAVALREYLEKARPQLVSEVSNEPALWYSRRRRPLTYAGVQHLVRRYADQLELKITAHLLRHACATHLLRSGAGCVHISELLGHSHLGTTEIYTQVKVEELRRVLERSHPRCAPGEG